jgi:hypothetical protein
MGRNMPTFPGLNGQPMGKKKAHVQLHRFASAT